MAGKNLFILAPLMLLGIGFEGLGVNFAFPILLGLDSDNQINRTLRSGFEYVGIEYKLLNLLIVLTIIVFLRCIFLFLQQRYIAKISTDMQYQLRSEIAEDIFDMQYEAYQQFSSGYLNNVLAVEALSAVSSFAKFSALICQILSTLVYGALAVIYIIIFLYSPFLFIVGFSSLLLLPLLKYINLKVKNYSVSATKHSGYLQKFIIESLRYFKYLKATDSSPKILIHINKEAKILSKLSYLQMFLAAASDYGADMLIWLFLATTIYYYNIIQGINILMLLIPLGMLYKAVNNARSLQANVRKFLMSWGSIDIIDRLDKDVKKYKEILPQGAEKQEIACDKPISLENVSFTFQSNNETILKDINLKIDNHSMIAFVGDSGSGKSTIVNLIISLLNVSKGKIDIGGVDYSTIDYSQLRKNVGYITQEDTVFHDTIYNNIVMWQDNEKKNMDQVVIATKKAHIHEFIDSLPEKYDSIMGEGGINISGGQRQRMCIARELYKDPEILIFDEATSALDTSTEKEIQKNIDELKGQKTIILIAHRISTIKNADVIYVLKKGQIVEKGTYANLCKADGEFAKMVERQS